MAYYLSVDLVKISVIYSILKKRIINEFNNVLKPLSTYFSLFMALYKKKISACSLPKLMLNNHFCLRFERPINIEVATFNPFCTETNRIHVMKAVFPCN